MVKAPEGVVTLDERGVRPGRGAYVCRDTTCIRAATNDDARRLRHALRTTDVAPAVGDLHDLNDQLTNASAS